MPKSDMFVWWVQHPEHTDAVVVAGNWEQATVEAAAWWDVPWGKVVAMCTEKEKRELTRGMCCECGAKMWSPGGNRVRCAMCDAAARQREETQRARNRRFYAEMHRK